MAKLIPEIKEVLSKQIIDNAEVVGNLVRVKLDNDSNFQLLIFEDESYAVYRSTSSYGDYYVEFWNEPLDIYYLRDLGLISPELYTKQKAVDLKEQEEISRKQAEKKEKEEYELYLRLNKKYQNKEF